jgi:hypothetical protein
MIFDVNQFFIAVNSIKNNVLIEITAKKYL